MPAIHVRDVPEQTLQTLKERAERSGQSLQAFVAALLEREAGIIGPAEAADIGEAFSAQSTLTRADILEAVALTRQRNS